MRKATFLLVAFLSLTLFIKADIVGELVSGNVTMKIIQNADGTFKTAFSGYGVDFNNNMENNPTLVVDVKLKTFFANYTSYAKEGDTLKMVSRIVAQPSTVVFVATDKYVALGNGAFMLNRNVIVESLGSNPYTNGFLSSFGLQFCEKNNLLDYNYFVPGVMYKGNFEQDGNIPSSLPSASDTLFLYRDDRTPLPVVMMRDKTTGVTATVVDAYSECRTVLNDSKDVAIDARYQFGGTGVLKYKKSDGFTAVATYPGSDNRKDGIGERRHPITAGFSNHSYSVYFKISKTDTYAAAVSDAWNTAFDIYNPLVRKTDLTHAYGALLETLNYYYLSPSGDSNVNVSVKRAGFPWSVYLDDFTTNSTTYEIGFVGAQPVAAYCLLRAGLDKGIKEYRVHATNILNFWASEGLSALGFPMSRYYCISGVWDHASCSMRQACTGMSGLLNAWCYYKKNGTDKTLWLDACKKFGEWLLSNQNDDGSYYMEYNPFEIVNQKHTVVKSNKYLTICAVRYLIEMYLTTGDERYKQAAVKAADFCYEKINQNYMYVACVVDNPQTIDSESGQQAINGFLSMYDLTKEKKWLDAAEQAATYTESWTFMHEVPVEDDQTGTTTWPKDSSIVGQHLIAIGHAACDLGFAWSSFSYYRLYLYTGNEHYLKVARISAHNSKQSMNLYGSLYPGQMEGLQQEAFGLKTNIGYPRRISTNRLEALTWNFTAHLDPMTRLKDAFGTVDLEEAEKLPHDSLVAMNLRYSLKQACDYGQSVNTGINSTTKKNNAKVFFSEGKINIESPDNTIKYVELFDIDGKKIDKYKGDFSHDMQIPLEKMNYGVYLVNIEYSSGKKDIIKFSNIIN